MAKRGKKPALKTTSTAPRPIAPFYFSKEQRTIFDTLVDLLQARGTLDSCDPTLIETYSVSLDLMRRAAQDIQVNGIANQTSQGRGKNPACDTVLACAQKLQILTTKMGLNPKALNSLNGALTDKEEWDDLI